MSPIPADPFSPEIENRLNRLVQASSDGFAVFDRNERLIYCNKAFQDVFCMSDIPSQGLCFFDILRNNYHNKRGLKIDCDDIEAFIAHVKSMRRSRPHRSFEVDYIDQRWFLISEQILDDGDLLMLLSDITKQKVLEQTLEARIDSLQSLALTDELTQVANRRSLVESVTVELARCRRSGAAMTMALIDLDHFKKVNDTYGHQAGDAALQHVTNIIRKNLRPFDILGRIGGEEFAIFLSNTQSTHALAIAERTRKAIQNSPLEYQGQQITLTTSIGLTTLGCNTSFEILYQQADEALYQAKKQGRNHVQPYISKAS